MKLSIPKILKVTNSSFFYFKIAFSSPPLGFRCRFHLNFAYILVFFLLSVLLRSHYSCSGVELLSEVPSAILVVVVFFFFYYPAL